MHCRASEASVVFRIHHRFRGLGVMGGTLPPRIASKDRSMVRPARSKVMPSFAGVKPMQQRWCFPKRSTRIMCMLRFIFRTKSLPGDRDEWSEWSF